MYIRTSYVCMYVYEEHCKSGVILDLHWSLVSGTARTYVHWSLVSGTARTYVH